MTRPEIEPKSLGPLANTVTIMPMSGKYIDPFSISFNSFTFLDITSVRKDSILRKPEFNLTVIELLLLNCSDIYYLYIVIFLRFVLFQIRDAIVCRISGGIQWSFQF